MDPFALLFYAVVCGLLSVVSPGFGGVLPRLAMGAGVGVLAAALLPYVKSLLAG